MNEKDKADKVIKSMRSYVMIPRVIINGCLLIEDEISGEGQEIDARRDILVDKGLALAVASAMKKHIGKEKVQRRGCAVLCKLSRSCNNEDKFHDLKIVEVMIQSMKHHQMSDIVQQYGCETLWNIAYKAKHKEMLMDIGAGDVAVIAMDNHKLNESVQLSGCGLLWNLSNDNINHQVRLLGIGAGEAVVSAMDNHKMSESIQHIGCHTLWNLSCTSESKITMMRMKAPHVIINAMNNHKLSDAVQIAACGALHYLSVDANNQRILLEIKAGEAIINAMTCHRGNAKVQHNGCATLSNLSLDSGNKAKLIEMGAVQTLINTLDNHKMNGLIQHYGCGALWNLSFNNSNKEMLMKLGCGDALLNAMINHKKSQSIQQECLGALWNLVKIESNIGLFTNLQLLNQTIQEVVDAFPESVASLEKNKCTIKDIGESILKAITEYEKNEEERQKIKKEEEEKSKHERRNKIDKMKQDIETKENEIQAIEVVCAEARADIVRKRRSFSPIEIANMEQEAREIENKMRALKSELDDLIEELNDECHDEHGVCVLPDLIMLNPHHSGGMGRASIGSINDIIKIPKAMKIRPERCSLFPNRVGDGGFSNVYKIKMIKKGREKDEIYAFKQFTISTSSIDGEEVKMIQDEVELLSQLKHDNIVKIIGAIGDPMARDANGERMGIGIVMEFCDNGSFRSLLNKNPNLSMNVIIHLLYGASQGLEYLHDHVPDGIIHGDIKSDNILIDSEFNAKICDFGISKLTQTTIATSAATRGNIGGTLAYKAPESFDGKIELKSDVYSFGCVVLEMLTGERPWASLKNDITAIITKVRIDKIWHDFSTIRKDARKELVDLMKKCLDYDKNKRWAMKEVRKEIEKMITNVLLVKLDEDTEEYTIIDKLFFPGADKEGTLTKEKYKIIKIEKTKSRFAESLYSTELKKIQTMVSRFSAGSTMSSTASSASSTLSITSLIENEEQIIVGGNEKLLFHGTSTTDPLEILNHPDSLMKDYSKEGFYGRGLYFAELARYSNARYAYNIPKTKQYQMLICSVACGKSMELGESINGSMSHKNLGTDYHSVHAGPHRPKEAGPGENDSCMYVVYKDTQVTPKYIVTYELIEKEEEKAETQQMKANSVI